MPNIIIYLFAIFDDSSIDLIEIYTDHLFNKIFFYKSLQIGGGTAFPEPKDNLNR